MDFLASVDGEGVEAFGGVCGRVGSFAPLGLGGNFVCFGTGGLRTPAKHLRPFGTIKGESR